ncbi:MAG: hypothetical protein ACJ76H_07920 [Bacteriovoracaceae bacterium]
MMKCEPHIEIMKKLQEQTRNCGVKLRSREESHQKILERLMQLQLDGETEGREYKFLSAILERAGS